MPMMNFMMKYLKWSRSLHKMIQKSTYFDDLNLRKYFSANFFLFLLLISILFLVSCKKEKDIIGLGVLPPSDLLDVEFNDSTCHIYDASNVKENSHPE